MADIIIDELIEIGSRRAGKGKETDWTELQTKNQMQKESQANWQDCSLNLGHWVRLGQRQCKSCQRQLMMMDQPILTVSSWLGLGPMEGIQVIATGTWSLH